MQLPPGWDLPEPIKARLGERAGRQRAMVAEGHLLLVLHKVPRAGESEREGVFFWREPDGTWKFSGGGSGLGRMQTHLEEYENAVEKLEAEYDQADDATEYFRIIEAAVPLHRAAKNLHGALQTARESLPDVRELIIFRDVAGDIERASELLQTDARNALDYKIARQAEEQARLGHEMNRAAHRLNLLASIFLPLTAIASILGTNLRSGLESDSPLVLWSIVALSIALGFGISRMLSKKS